MSAKDDLEAAVNTVRYAVTMLSAVRPTMEAFLQECRDMDNFGSVLRPELFMDPRRRKISDAIEPLFKASILLLEAHSAAAVTMVEAMVASANQDAAK